LKKILLCEDDNVLLKVMARSLKRVGFAIIALSSAEDVLQEDFSHLSLIIIDIGLPGMRGDELLKRLISKNIEIPIIIISGNSDVSLAVECMKNGAYNYLEKPFEENYLISSVIDAIGDNEIEATTNEYNYEYFSRSNEVNELTKIIKKIAGENISVFMYGESGSGKEFYAKEIYKSWHRPDVPFVSVNCPAIPDSLAESELFGHEKGSFTGADKLKIGKFEFANNGVLFLDEIGDLSLEIQAKLLRVLEEKEIERVGSNEKIKLNIQLISASSQDIKSLIAEGKFRSDLYYRLSDIELKVPPLKSRIEDIDFLVSHFISQYEKETGKLGKTFSESSLNILKSYDWPGNIRELRSTVRRMMILSKGNVVTPDDLSVGHFGSLCSHMDTSKKIARVSGQIQNQELELIRNSIKTQNGNLTKVSKDLGISRATLYRKIKKYGI